MSQCTQDDRRRDLREIGLEEELQTFRGVRQRDGTETERHEDDEQQRHHPFRGAFDAFLDAAGDEDMRHDDERQGPDNRAYGVCGERGERRAELFGALACDISRKRFNDIFECPACNDGIVAENQESRPNAVVSDEAPLRSGRDGLESAGRVAARMTAEIEFGDHQRNAEQQHAADIN